MNRTFIRLVWLAAVLLTALSAKAQYVDEQVPDFFYFNQYGVFLTPEGSSVVTIPCGDMSQEQIWEKLLEKAGYYGSFSAARVTVLSDQAMVVKEWFGDLGAIRLEETLLFGEGYISVEFRVLDGAILMGAPKPLNPIKLTADDEEYDTTFTRLAATYFDPDGYVLPQKMDDYLLRVFWINQWLYRLVGDFLTDAGNNM